MRDVRCERVFSVENAGKDVVCYSIVGLGEAEIFLRTVHSCSRQQHLLSSVIIPKISTMSTRK